MQIKIYSGLCLQQSDVQHSLPQAICCPPVRRGDVLKDIAQGVQVIGIVDGEFFQNMAVTPSEIIDALRVGVRVYGAGSMGALRAAELDGFGMQGCGEIYRQICEEAYFADDYLGVIFDAPDEPQLSLPMVDFCATLRSLRAAAALTAEQAQELRQVYGALHFTERNIESLAQHLQVRETDGLHAALAVVRQNVINQKRRDGFAMLAHIAQDLANTAHINHLINH
jgi:hypothetical protein